MIARTTEPAAGLSLALAQGLLGPLCSHKCFLHSAQCHLRAGRLRPAVLLDPDLNHMSILFKAQLCESKVCAQFWS